MDNSTEATPIWGYIVNKHTVACILLTFITAPHPALSPAQTKRYPQPLLVGSKLNVTYPLSIVDNGHTTAADNLTTPYLQHNEAAQIKETNVLTPKKYQKRKKVEIDSEPHYEFANNDDRSSDNNNGQVKRAVRPRVTHPVRTATPPKVRKPLSAIIRQEDLPRNFMPNFKVPILPPTPGQTRNVELLQPPSATRPFPLNPKVKSSSRQPDPPLGHYEFAEGLQPSPLLLKPNGHFTPAEKRPKSYAVEQGHYDLAGGTHTLPVHYEHVQASSSKQAHSKLADSKSTPMDSNYEFVQATSGGKQAHSKLADSKSTPMDSNYEFVQATSGGKQAHSKPATGNSTQTDSNHYEFAGMIPAAGDKDLEYAYATPNTRRQVWMITMYNY